MSVQKEHAAVDEPPAACQAIAVGSSTHAVCTSLESVAIRREIQANAGNLADSSGWDASLW
ncbi:MAG: hypothetical protein IT423_03570 [Pirellulaceae bacterium]|nr:hypothetical protein [Pirellulaceae bacterium]